MEGKVNKGKRTSLVKKNYVMQRKNDKRGRKKEEQILTNNKGQ